MRPFCRKRGGSTDDSGFEYHDTRGKNEGGRGGVGGRPGVGGAAEEGGDGTGGGREEGQERHRKEGREEEGREKGRQAGHAVPRPGETAGLAGRRAERGAIEGTPSAHGEDA